MEKELYILQIIQCIKETSIIMIFKVSEHIHGVIKENMKVNGIKIKCMDKEKFRGKMAEIMKENIKMIKSMDMEYLTGQMEEYIKGIMNFIYNT